MDVNDSYNIAKTLENEGYWKNVLPDKCYSRLLIHLESLESWCNFYENKLSDNPISSPSSSLKGKNSKSPNNDKKIESNNEEKTEHNMRTTRRKHLGEDVLLSFRIRVLLLDSTLFNSATLSKKDQLNKNFYFDDMYYTLECDYEDWAATDEQPLSKDITNTQDFSFSGIYNIDTPLFEPEHSKKNTKRKSKQSSSRRTKRSSNSSRELRNLLSDVKSTKSWSNSDIEGFEELYNGLDRTMTQLKAYEEHSYPFLTRVRKSDAPDYYDIIKKPIDLSVMTKKIKKLEYNSKKEFQADLDLMFANCRQYNTDPKSIYIVHAAMLDKYAKKLLRSVRNIDCTEQRKQAENKSKSTRTSEDNEVNIIKSPVTTPRSRGRGRGRPKKGTVVNKNQSNTTNDNNNTLTSPSTTKLQKSSKKNSSLISSVNSLNDSSSDISLIGSDSDDSHKMNIASTNEFLAEDPQIRSWRLKYFNSRVDRVRDANLRNTIPFEHWECVKRTSKGMIKYREYYEYSQSRNSFFVPPIKDDEEIIVIDNTSNSILLNQSNDEDDIHNYLPENHIADSFPELPILAPSFPKKKYEGLSNKQALVKLQKALVIILTQKGFQGCNTLPFDVLSDLLLSFFQQIGRKIQMNNISNDIDIIKFMLHETKYKTSNLYDFSKITNISIKEDIEKDIRSNSIYDVVIPSPEEIIQSNIYTFQPTVDTTSEPPRKKLKPNSDSPKKKRGRPKKKKV